MAKVKLLKNIGNHKSSTEIEINDISVLEKWEELGVIEKSKTPKEKVTKTDK